MADAPIITFRPLTARELPMIHEWLSRAHVAEWWGPQESLADVTAKYGAYIADPTAVQPHIVWSGGERIGYAQSYVAMGSGDGWWTDEREPGVRGIDQYLANAAQLGQGLGTTMVRALVRKLFGDPAVTRIQTDPAPANARAIRCYEKAGFHAVGEIDTPDGRALLMHCERNGAQF